MRSQSLRYVPSLFLRQAEYQALFRLASSAKGQIAPLITIPEIEFDFELKRPAKSLDDHLSRMPARLTAKWGARAAWLDVHSAIATTKLADGRIPLHFIFEELSQQNVGLIPVVSPKPNAVVLAAAKRIARQADRGVGLRIGITDIMSRPLQKLVDDAATSLGIEKEQIDILLDLGAPNFDPLEEFVAALAPLLPGKSLARSVREYVLVSCGFPKSIQLKKPGGRLPRLDWHLYQAIVAHQGSQGLPTPTFGDYTIVHPNFPLLDPRKMKPAGKIVYATGTEWVVRKGGSFRDDNEQMHSHAQFIAGQKFYRGPKFSSGDEFIQQCARREVGPSNLSRWKEVGVSHHIMETLMSIATLGAAA